jgi:hypothetical protein
LVVDISGKGNHLLLKGGSAPTWLPNNEGLMFAPSNFLELNPIDLSKYEFIINFWYMQDNTGVDPIINLVRLVPQNPLLTSTFMIRSIKVGVISYINLLYASLNYNLY